MKGDYEYENLADGLVVHYINKGNKKGFARAREEFLKQREEFRKEKWSCYDIRKDDSGVTHYLYRRRKGE